MECVHHLEVDDRVVTLSWAGQIDVVPARVYAMAFPSEAEILLVSGGPGDPDRWLPGGGMEAGETPEAALRRELLEEADASIVALQELGSCRWDDPKYGLEYHRWYWCRVMLADQVFPRAESTLRHVVSPEDFLDRLKWGHSDPKAALLLRLALEAESKYRG